MFQGDTLLRDIYVLDTTEDDWDRFLSFVHSSGHQISFKIDEEENPLPKRITEIFLDTEHSHTLAIDLGHLALHCYFFSDLEIELDLVASEVMSQNELDQVLEFIIGLGAHLSRDVILTEESFTDYVLFKYSYDESKIRFLAENVDATSEVTRLSFLEKLGSWFKVRR